MAPDSTCAIHQTPLVNEPGGPTQPTVHGRTYCPACQTALNVALSTALTTAEMAPQA